VNVLPLVNGCHLSRRANSRGKPIAATATATERALGTGAVVELAANGNPSGPAAKAVAAIQRTQDDRLLAALDRVFGRARWN
jgi:hypothetical protein